MSDNQNEDDELRTEIQNLLKQINSDMNKLKNELNSMHSLIDENAQLPINIKIVNEKLIIAATEAGIDLEDINEGDISEQEEDLEDASLSVSALNNLLQEGSGLNDQPMASVSNDEPMASVLNDEPMASVLNDEPMNSVSNDEPMASVSNDEAMGVVSNNEPIPSTSKNCVTDVNDTKKI